MKVKLVNITTKEWFVWIQINHMALVEQLAQIITGLKMDNSKMVKDMAILDLLIR